MDENTAKYLANEARKQIAKLNVATLKGRVDGIETFMRAMDTGRTAAYRDMLDAQEELARLELGNGPGITDDFGTYSSTDQALQNERFAGKAAAVEFIKANPTCTEQEACAAYIQAALDSRPAGRKWLLQAPDALRQEYSANLVAYGLIPDASWESWRAWILATPTEVILGLN